jgi:hypothetical protein
MTKIRCRCLFDITATGVTGHFKSARVPFQDRAGKNIVNNATWNRSRNQQRNWETLTQLISLRTQVTELTDPVRADQSWEFEFATETHAELLYNKDKLLRNGEIWEQELAKKLKDDYPYR